MAYDSEPVGIFFVSQMPAHQWSHAQYAESFLLKNQLDCEFYQSAVC